MHLIQKALISALLRLRLLRAGLSRNGDSQKVRDLSYRPPANGVHGIKPRKPMSIFFRELLSNPRNVGAACPSSKRLANSMAAQVALPGDDYVVELGAGTGVVTEALLRRGVPPNRLVVIEKSGALASVLQARFPDVHVIRGDAAVLGELLASYFYPEKPMIKTIVSSLPLKALPKPVVRAIKQQIEQYIPADGSLIQFTYDIRPGRMRGTRPFRKQNSTIVWRNLPPARVDHLKKSTGS